VSEKPISLVNAKSGQDETGSSIQDSLIIWGEFLHPNINIIQINIKAIFFINLLFLFIAAC